MKDICCIGHVTKDKIVTPSSTVYMAGGTSFYFAYAINQLPKDVSFSLITAMDPTEKEPVEKMLKAGIDVTLNPSRNTVFFENIYGDNPNDRKQRVLAKADPFTIQQLEHVEAKVFHLGSLLSDDFSPEVVAFLAKKGKVSIDVQGYLREVRDEKVYAIDWKDKLDVLKNTYYLKVNETEMETITGLKDPKEAAKLIHAWGVAEVIITLGSEGSLVYVDDTFYDIPAYPPHEVVDATGCGDTYSAGYLYKRLQGANPVEAGKFAAAMCTIKLAHATGHLIYSRFWNKFLYDLGYVCEKEPFRKLVNQGMIQGRSNFVYRVVGTNTFVSLGLKDKYETTEIHVDVNIVHNDRLDLEAFRNWLPDYRDAEFILEDGEYICGWAIEKMSKSMFNVVNPDKICDDYGADTLRLYEMFLGPVEQSKPWDTKGIDGVHRFLRKLWRLFYERENFIVTDEKASPAELKSLHKLIGKAREDIENFSFNTTVSAFMIAVGELADCHKREILEPLLIVLSPFAPHIAEELWQALGHGESICNARFPEYVEAYTHEDSCTYAVSFNGKTRFTVEQPKSASREEVEAYVRSLEQTAKYVAGLNIVKVIVVPGKIVNIVVK